MLAIRLFRTGKKHQPFYKIVVTDKRRAPSGGRFVDEVGFYNPITKEKKFEAEKIKSWILKGAQPSDTVHNFLVSEKILEGKKVNVYKKSKKKKEDAEVKSPNPQETSKPEEKPESASPVDEEAKESIIQDKNSS